VNRIRALYFGLALVTIAVGLLVHLRGTALAPAVRDVSGDALWATMIMWLVSTLTPASRTAARGAAAYAICVVVEVSQLYHAPTVDAIRATFIGRLVLGSDFDVRDLAAYAVGVASAMLLDAALIVRARQPRATI
jgi:hypothetical protein